jgi:hypothetical protein
MLIAVLLFNVSTYSLTAIATRLNTTPTLVSSPTKFLPGDRERALPQQNQDWLLPAPATTKLCFGTNIFLGLTSGAMLVNAFFWWMTNASLVSVAVRNYALAYGLGAGIAGIVFVHVLLVPRPNEGMGFLMAVNTILGPVLTGLAFGTMK